MTFFSITKKIGLWYLDHFIGTSLVLISLSAITVSAAGSWDVNNEPQMYLYSPLTTTSTTIVLDAPQLNGDDWTFATTSGGVLRIRSGLFREDVYFPSATVNATTYRVTMTGVTRDLCPQVTKSFVSCGNGRRWGKGAIVELIQDSRLFNLKLNSDRINTTGTGFALRTTSTTLPIVRFNNVTTAQRTAMSAGNGDMVYDSTIGANFQYVAGAWSQVGDTGTVNASESAAGKVQLGGTGAMLARTATGSTGAYDVVQTKFLTSTGGTLYKYFVPILNQLGVLPRSMGGTGTGAITNSGILIGGINGMRSLSPASNSGKTIISDGEEWKAMNQPIRMLDSKIAAGSNAGSSSTAEPTVYTYAMSGSSIAAGDRFVFHIGGVCRAGAGTPTVRMRIGSASGTIMTAIGASDPLECTSGENSLYLDASVLFRTIGAGGTASGDMHIEAVASTDAGNDESGVSSTIGDIAVNTTGSVRFTITVQFAASNANNYIRYEQASLIKYSLQ